eukprot:TRINITY_DN25171_c0_g1_i1.p1 TRINITY_DN25171_c0_g1~~TRINITY_DN25171_c0_g1_i1.p1  ORF type:complete len:254 (+),score=18.98 TRINITY_DN25171_c0_g1_i1:57-764(+)
MMLVRARYVCLLYAATQLLLCQQIRPPEDDAQPISPPQDDADRRGLPPRWISPGDMEKPQGIQNMGSWNAMVYTKDQQERLGVDMWGKPAKGTAQIDRPKLLSAGLGPQICQQVFTRYDFDDDHALSYPEVLFILMHIRQSPYIPINFQTQVHTSISTFDADRSLRLEMVEFEKFIDAVFEGRLLDMVSRANARVAVAQPVGVVVPVVTAAHPDTATKPVVTLNLSVNVVPPTRS